MSGTPRGMISRRRLVHVLVVLAGIWLAATLILARLPRPVAAVATIDQCAGGWPVLVFEGEDWKNALPDDLRRTPPYEIPIAEWPPGMLFDQSTGSLHEENGRVA